jgi:hypothetical protein
VDAAAVTAIVAVGVSGVVGVTAVVVPAAVRRGDRRHERQMKVDDKRAEAYGMNLALMSRMQEFLESPPTDDLGSLREQLNVADIQLWLWGSPEVRDLFRSWRRVAITEGSASEDVMEAADALRRRMSDELQGRV